VQSDIRFGVRRHRSLNADDLKSMRRHGSSWQRRTRQMTMVKSFQN